MVCGDVSWVEGRGAVALLTRHQECITLIPDCQHTPSATRTHASSPWWRQVALAAGATYAGLTKAGIALLCIAAASIVAQPWARPVHPAATHHTSQPGSLASSERGDMERGSGAAMVAGAHSHTVHYSTGGVGGWTRTLLPCLIGCVCYSLAVVW
jgi:hypothetical protein